MTADEHIIDYRCHVADNALAARITEQFADRPLQQDALLSKIGRPRLSYLIYDGEQLVDGEILHGAEACIKALGYLSGAKHVDLIIFAADFLEARSGSTPMRDVTEDMVRMAFDGGYITADSALAQAYVDEARDEAEYGWIDPNDEHRTFNRAGAL